MSTSNSSLQYDTNTRGTSRIVTKVYLHFNFLGVSTARYVQGGVLLDRLPKVKKTDLLDIPVRPNAHYDLELRCTFTGGCLGLTILLSHILEFFGVASANLDFSFVFLKLAGI